MVYMAKDDYAIIVGVSCYPEIGSLDAPATDARAFYDWVVSSAGGDVPKKHAKLIVSPKSKNGFSNVLTAKPTMELVINAMAELEELAKQNLKKKKRQQVGRRLYLYFAGHGFFDSAHNQTYLLMANATPNRTGPPYHVLGPWSADWFWKSCYFEEVVLIMDCCRDNYLSQGLNFAFGEVNCEEAVGRAKYFYGYATQQTRTARERPMEDGITRGVFTAALLDGLRANCRITADSLKGYLYARMKSYFDEDDLKDPQITTEPDIDVFPKIGDGIIFKEGEKGLVPRYKVKISLPAGSKKKKLEILRGQDFKQVVSTVVELPAWQGKLESGFYLVEIRELRLRAVIEVIQEGNVDARFEKIN
jgi:hypothetical protein